MRSNRGQSLIEVAVAVAVIAMASVILVQAVSRAMANNRLAKERIIATRLAQEGWEWLQRQAGDDWDGLFGEIGLRSGHNHNVPVYYCLNDGGPADIKTWLYSIVVNHTGESVLSSGGCGAASSFTIDDTNYRREVKIRHFEAGPPADEGTTPINHLKAEVTVSWFSRGKTQAATVSGTISD